MSYSPTCRRRLALLLELMWRMSCLITSLELRLISRRNCPSHLPWLAVEKEFGLVVETSCPVAGLETDLLMGLSEPGSGCEADLQGELGGGQVWRHARPVGIGHAPLFQQTKF